jgi:hypothetical protein
MNISLASILMEYENALISVSGKIFLRKMSIIETVCLFTVQDYQPGSGVKNAAGIAMREIVGKNTISLLVTCFHTGFLLGLSFDPENGGNMFLRNVGLTFNGLHGIISQNIVLFSDNLVCNINM